MKLHYTHHQIFDALETFSIKHFSSKCSFEAFVIYILPSATWIVYQQLAFVIFSQAVSAVRKPWHAFLTIFPTSVFILLLRPSAFAVFYCTGYGIAVCIVVRMLSMGWRV